MSEPRRMPLDEGSRRFRGPLAWGLLLSVALHAAAALAWRAAPGPGVLAGDAPPERARPARTRARDAVRVLELRLPSDAPPTEIPRPPAPVEAAAPDVGAPRLASEAGVLDADLAPHPHGRPSAAARATGGGGRRGRPPVPRSVLPEWRPPEEVRGTTVVVRVHVDTAGRPTGAVELLPPTPDEAFNRRLREKVGAMTFDPARRGGRPVDGWAELTFVF